MRFNFFPLLLPAIILTHACGSTSDTAMFRGDAAHSGLAASAAPKQLRVHWVFDPVDDPRSPREPMLSSPVAVDHTLFVGSSDNHLYALDAGTGKLKWRFKTTGGLFQSGGNVTSTPAVAKGVVYFMCNDGVFYAVNAADGTLRWSFATGGERRFTTPGVNYLQPASETMPDPWDFFLSSPTVIDGAVYFGCGDHCIYSLDAATGALRWKYTTGDVVHASPAVAGGVVYIGSFDTWFYALDAAKGTLLWKFKTGEDNTYHNQTGLPGSAAVAGSTVYFGCRDSNFYALNASTGELRWKFSNNGSWVIASPAVRDHVVYFTTSDSFKFEALDAESGKELYALTYGTYAFSSPTLAGSRAYFGTFDGLLHSVDLTARKFADSFGMPGYDKNKGSYLTPEGHLKNEVWSGETFDDCLLALRTKIFSLGSLLATPCVSDGVVFISSADGRVYALGE